MFRSNDDRLEALKGGRDAEVSVILDPTEYPTARVMAELENGFLTLYTASGREDTDGCPVLEHIILNTKEQARLRDIINLNLA